MLQRMVALLVNPVIPTLSNVAMTSSNGVNPAFAKADDIITITTIQMKRLNLRTQMEMVWWMQMQLSHLFLF